MGKYSKLAEDIIKNVGGKENIIDLKHCITRLRFNLKDESIANDDVLKNMDGVITVMKAMGQYMVVIGAKCSWDSALVGYGILLAAHRVQALLRAL